MAKESEMQLQTGPKPELHRSYFFRNWNASAILKITSSTGRISIHIFALD
jgi:hypothetical protein